MFSGVSNMNARKKKMKRLTYSIKNSLFCAAISVAVLLAGCRHLGHVVESGKEDLLAAGRGVPFVAPKYYPAFSWEKVPVYMMFADDRLLNDSEVRKIAAESDFICIEKHHGRKPLGDAALGLKHENSVFKQLEPGIKVLGYFNGALAYPFTRYTEMLTTKRIDEHPEMKAYLVADPKTGELAITRGLFGYNVLNPDMRAWWSDAVADMVRESGADGIFIDQMHGLAWLHQSNQRSDVEDGVADMMRQLKAKIGPDKILLANNGAHIEEIFSIADAFMFEHYKREVTHTKEKLLQDWSLMKKIADAGKICVYRFGAEPAPGSGLAAPNRSARDEEWAELSKEQLPFYLAVYLIGAQPYSYFQWGWGWGLNTGPLENYPEFQKPLGKPLGEHKRVHADGWEFTREFEHASVWVDTDKWEANIEWYD